MYNSIMVSFTYESSDILKICELTNVHILLLCDTLQSRH